MSNTVTLAPPTLLFLDFLFPNLSHKFFLWVGQLVHLFLCFALHINELLKLDGIIFCMFEAIIEGVSMQTNN